MKYAIIDVETTGTSAKSGKIIEIAVVLHDGEKIEESFSTLIDPERSLPQYITHLTGINQEMLQDAPPFYSVAKKIIELTQNRIFVAHNVGFDFEFVRKEFEDLGYSFFRKKLCTVRLARKIFPGLKSYSLGNLCALLNLVNNRPHRALEDALATSELFQKIINRAKIMGYESLLELETSSVLIPPKLSKELVDQLPEKTGIYKFLDDSQNVIYIGKSKNIKKRVIEHFSSKGKNRKDQSFHQIISNIETIETGSEIVALLLENELIKKIRPPFNIARRRTNFKWGLLLRNDQLDVRELQLEEEALSYYSSKKAAVVAIEKYQKWIELGLNLSEHPDFQFPNDRRIYIDKGRSLEEASYILVDQGRVLGFGFSNQISKDMFYENLPNEGFFHQLTDYPDAKTLLLPFLNKLRHILIPKQDHFYFQI